MKIFWSEEEIKQVILNCKRFNEKFLKKEDLKTGKNGVSFEGLENRIRKLESADTVKMYEDKLQNLERKLGQLMSDFDAYKRDKTSNTESLQDRQQQGEQYTDKFPPPITKSGFPNNLSNSQGDSYFRFFNIKDDTAKFDFCGKDFERAKANKTELEQACDISGSAIDAKKITNITKGTVTLCDSKWEITEKAKIKFE